jgi:hypothetical protein
MAAIDPNDLQAALGATPPTTPTGTNTTAAQQAAFRAQRTALRAVLNVVAPQPAVVAAPQAPPAPSAGQAAPLPVVPTRPNAGGLATVKNEQVAWVGGGYTPATAITKPFSVLAYRSSDLSLALKVEKECTVGLPETRRLTPPGTIDTKDASSSVTLTQWIRTLAHAIKERGLDPVFRATIDGTEVFLLEKWGKATKENVDAHVTHLRNNGDEYDLQNLKLSAKYLMNSLDNDMLKRTEQELGNTLAREATGPDVYAAVIALHSVLNDSTERFYINTLSKHKLIDEPGENVGTFSDKVVSIAHHIEGISENRVSDLHTLIYQCFEGSSTPTFATAVSTILAKCFQNDATVRDWEANVTMLKSMYRDLVTRSSWVALKNAKEKVEAQGLRATTEVKSLKAELKRLTKIVSGRAGPAPSSTSTSSHEVTCYWCGEKGHTKPNCPNTDKPKKFVSARGGNARTSNATSHAVQEFKTKVGPKSGESHTKTVKGTLHKWCDTCKKWNSGDKAHITSEHIKGKNVQPQQVAGGLAQMETALGPTLSFVAGYTAAVSRAYVPPCPVPSDFTVDMTSGMHYICDQFDRASIESALGCRSDTPGAVYCRICQQYFTDHQHDQSHVHLQNCYLSFRYLETRGLLPTEEEPSTSTIPFVAGYIGAISSHASVEEEENRTIVNGTTYCSLCQLDFTETLAEHEQTNDHWQRWLIESMRTYFAEHVIMTDNAPSVESNHNCDDWILVANKKRKPKETALKGKTGQRQSKRC